MGRSYWDKKRTVEDCKSISMPLLRKNGYFDSLWPRGIVWTNWRGEETASMTVSVHISEVEGHVRLMYTMTDRDTRKQTPFDHKVQLATTPCHLGGARWWFLCPLSRKGVYCGRRVAKLYRAPRADYYGCRHCYDLSYESRNESRRGRFAHMDRFLLLNKRREKLMEEMTRWTYRGIPTRKARWLQILDARLKAYGKAHLADLM